MIFHLGMSGRWRVDPGEIGKHDHLLLETDAGRRLSAYAIRAASASSIWCAAMRWILSRLRWRWGRSRWARPSPAPRLRARLGGKKTAIKLALLDQRVSPGWAISMCARRCSKPASRRTRAAGSLSAKQASALVAAIKEVLTAAIAAGGSSLRDYARPDGELGYFAKQWCVYGREGEPCPRCGAPVLRRTEGGRSTFYCGVCQGLRC
jgi:formamidopyrimidine-DNA glycosylase